MPELMCARTLLIFGMSCDAKADAVSKLSVDVGVVEPKPGVPIIYLLDRAFKWMLKWIFLTAISLYQTMYDACRSSSLQWQISSQSIFDRILLPCYTRSHGFRPYFRIGLGNVSRYQRYQHHRILKTCGDNHIQHPMLFVER